MANSFAVEAAALDIAVALTVKALVRTPDERIQKEERTSQGGVFGPVSPMKNGYPESCGPSKKVPCSGLLEWHSGRQDYEFVILASAS